VTGIEAPHSGAAAALSSPRRQETDSLHAARWGKPGKRLGAESRPRNASGWGCWNVRWSCRTHDEVGTFRQAGQWQRCI